MTTVSVIIPCYNHAGYIGETIESVLAQTHPAAEIIVVDDGSKDASAEVAERYAQAHPTVRLIRQTNAGRSAAANHGLRESLGDLLVFLDADDRLLPHALARGLEHLEAHPEAALVSGHCIYIDPNGIQMDTLGKPVVIEASYARLLEANFIWNPGNALFRRSAVEAVGGFDTTLKHAEDYSIYLRIARNHPIFYYEDIIAEYRQHPNNKSKNAHTMLQTLLSIMQTEAPYAKSTAETYQAWRQGVRHNRAFYGNLCLLQFLSNLGPQGDRQKAWVTLKTLMRYYPNPKAFAWYFKRQWKAKRKSSALQHKPL